jgi:hypothetical protein
VSDGAAPSARCPAGAHAPDQGRRSREGPSDAYSEGPSPCRGRCGVAGSQALVRVSEGSGAQVLRSRRQRAAGCARRPAGSSGSLRPACSTCPCGRGCVPVHGASRVRLRLRPVRGIVHPCPRGRHRRPRHRSPATPRTRSVTGGRPPAPVRRAPGTQSPARSPLWTQHVAVPTLLSDMSGCFHRSSPHPVGAGHRRAARAVITCGRRVHGVVDKHAARTVPRYRHAASASTDDGSTVGSVDSSRPRPHDGADRAQGRRHPRPATATRRSGAGPPTPPAAPRRPR